MNIHEVIIKVIILLYLDITFTLLCNFKTPFHLENWFTAQEFEIIANYSKNIHNCIYEALKHEYLIVIENQENPLLL